jgi:hypothetical protein
MRSIWADCVEKAGVLRRGSKSAEQPPAKAPSLKHSLPKGDMMKRCSKILRRFSSLQSFSTESALSRPPRLTQDAAVQPVIAAIRAERSILTALSSVCGTKQAFAAVSTKVRFYNYDQNARRVRAIGV